MSYDLRPATIDGEACSTCRYAVMLTDRYGEPFWRCYSLMTDVTVIDNPDETVCNAWKEIP